MEKDWGYMGSCSPKDSLQLEGGLNVETKYETNRCKRELSQQRK